MFNNNQRRSPAARGSDTSLIARGTTIVGDVHFAGALHLDGRIEGTVLADADSGAVFTLSTEGQVVGEVRVPVAVINGTVKGDLHAGEHLELALGARIEGDVHYQVLEMAAGAEINGRMMHHGVEPPRQLTGPGMSTSEASGDATADVPAADAG